MIVLVFCLTWLVMSLLNYLFSYVLFPFAGGYERWVWSILIAWVVAFIASFVYYAKHCETKKEEKEEKEEQKDVNPETKSDVH